MNRIFSTSASRLIAAATPRSASAGLYRASARVSYNMPSTSVFVRGFATKKTVSGSVVDTEAKAKSDFLRLLDEELTVLKATDQEDNQQNASLRTEITNRFLDETGFKRQTPEEGVIRLVKTVGDKTVHVSWTDKPIEVNEEEYDEEDGDNAETQEGNQEGDQKEAEESEERGEDPLKREQPFRVEIFDKNHSDKKVLLNCYAATDGSFIVSELNFGDGSKIPIPISQWSEDLQRGLIQYLEPLGVNERLSYYIHQDLDEMTHKHNMEILKDFIKFVGEN